MSLGAALVFIGWLLFVFIAIELLISMIRNDGVYTWWMTVNNTLNGLISKFIASQSTAFILGAYVFLKINTIIPPRFDLTLFSFTICLLLVDFFYYLFHRMHHTFEFFWTFHHVHHGDDTFNLSTALRVSWIEQLYIFLFFVPVVLVGFPAQAVVLAYFTLSMYQVFCHGQYVQLPRFFDSFMVTPHNHRIHHDNEQQNSNFGGTFSIWDRLFGTYTEEIATFNPGIKGYHQENFIMMELDPIIAYVKKHFGKKS